MKFRYGLCFYVLLIISPVIASGDALPAFPGAEGFGAAATGGRGGEVIRVTNLNSAGPGSLNAACAASGPRIVVFDVSGVIYGDVTIRNPDITIAGETAPGGGITIAGRFLTSYNYSVQNIIVRFIRIRPPHLSGNQGDGIQFTRASNFILDHVSVSWGTDETIDVFESRNFTIQWCTIEESAPFGGHPDGDWHNYGLINGPNGWNSTIHHNLFAHHRRRAPAIANGPADIRNNVIYNVRDCFVHDNPSNNGGFNIVGNYYRKGPNQPENPMFPFGFAQGIEYYLSDNYIDHPPHLDQVIEDPWTEGQHYVGLNFYSERGVRVTTPFEMPPVETHSSEEVYRIVLEKAGAWPRDVVTLRTVDEVRRRTGEWARQVPDDLMAGLTPESPPQDSDGDGIPDYWKIMHGMDPDSPDANGDFNGNGYTNIEDYLHYRAALLIGERWNSYRVRDGWVDTNEWMGRLYVLEDPWIFSENHNSWLFQPQLTQGKFIYPEWWFVPNTKR